MGKKKWISREKYMARLHKKQQDAQLLTNRQFQLDNEDLSKKYRSKQLTKTEALEQERKLKELKEFLQNDQLDKHVGVE